MVADFYKNAPDDDGGSELLRERELIGGEATW
jgi:hypothetical protein